MRLIYPIAINWSSNFFFYLSEDTLFKGTIDAAETASLSMMILRRTKPTHIRCYGNEN